MRTKQFPQESLLKGSVDLDVASRLDQEYEQLALDAPCAGVVAAGV